MTDVAIIEAGAKAIWDARRAREGGNITWEQANAGKDEFPNTYIVVENTRQEAADCLAAALCEVVDTADKPSPGSTITGKTVRGERSDLPPPPISHLVGREWGDDWTVDDTDTAREILLYLGIGDDASREPGADRRRDRVAQIIRARIDVAAQSPAEHLVAADIPLLADLQRHVDEVGHTEIGQNIAAAIEVIDTLVSKIADWQKLGAQAESQLEESGKLMEQSEAEIWALREKIDRLSAPVDQMVAGVATVSDHNAAYDPADDAFGGAFKDGFREGWLFAKDPRFEDREEIEADYSREVDIAPSECWDAYKETYFAMLPLAAIPEVGDPMPTPLDQMVAGEIALTASQLCVTPFIEELIPNDEALARCEHRQDVYDLMKARVRAAFALAPASRLTGPTLEDFALRLFDLHGFMLLETYKGKHAVTVTFPDLAEAQQFHGALVELSTHRPRPRSLLEGSDNG